jgi:hypothetical protein
LLCGLPIGVYRPNKAQGGSFFHIQKVIALNAEISTYAKTRKLMVGVYRKIFHIVVGKECSEGLITRVYALIGYAYPTVVEPKPKGTIG